MQTHSKFVARRQIIQLPCSMLILASVGCMAPWLSKPDPHSPEAKQARRDEIKKALISSEDVPRISEFS